LKGKEVHLPKLGLGKAAAIIDQEKENRDLMFENDDEEENGSMDNYEDAYSG
jgi:hypothetical protein